MVEGYKSIKRAFRPTSDAKLNHHHHRHRRRRRRRRRLAHSRRMADKMVILHEKHIRHRKPVDQFFEMI
jgi:hypothetical protein